MLPRISPLTISSKLWLLAFSAAMGISIIVVACLLSERALIVEERRNSVRQEVETAYGVLAHYQALAGKGVLAEDQAKHDALEAIKALDYGAGEYFWINDMQPRMIMHPIKPELDGSDLTGYQDPTGKHLFVEAVKAVKEHGGGFVSYMWPKPGEDEPVAKMSYVKGFAPWGWIIGSGVYMDSVEATFRDQLTRFLIGGLALSGVLVGASLMIARSITRPLNQAINIARTVATGDLSTHIGLQADDETGQLLHALREMSEGLVRVKRAEDERQEALDRLQRIASRVPGMVYQYRVHPDGSSCFPFASDAIREIYRVGPEEVKEDAAKVVDTIHPDDLPGVVASVRESANNLTPWHHEYRIRFDDGTVRWLFGNALPQREEDGSVLWHGFVTDVTARKQAEAALRVAATAFEAQEGMFVTDANSVILQVNHAFTDVTGYSAQEAVGQTPRLLNSGRHDAAFYARMWESIRCTGSWQGEIWNRRKSGEVYAEWLIITAVLGADGEIINYVGTLTDITARKAAEEEIRYLAYYDPLTRLPNRRLLLDRLQQALASRARSGREGAVLFIDLDNFKDLNDTLGHDKGDLLLLQVAQRLSSCIREGDTLARLGGDEFVVMLEDLSQNMQEAANQVEIVGEKILAALSQTYTLSGHSYHSTSSIGATLFADHRNTIDELLKRADLAMYQAKAAGRNALRFFDPEMQAAVNARTALEADLREGLLHNQFLVYYQAQVDTHGKPSGVEALVRWQHPVRKLVSPVEFIPVAEETGLILPLGRWVLETACAQLTAWSRRPELAHLTIAVNVSSRQIRQPDFVEQVLEVLKNTGANPHRLKLELTESLLLDDVEQTISKMSLLKAHGVGFSLDDFGTGYSSLSYLKRLPLDQLKIDQSFVRDVLIDPNDAAIARTIVALAQNLGLTVIAEGVETEEQRDFLSKNDCKAYQGYLFSQPIPIDLFETYMEEYAGRHANGVQSVG